MNALIQSLQDKIGLTADQAKDAASHMMDFLKEKIPASMHGHIDAAAIGDDIKAKASEFLASAQSKGSDFLHAAQEKMSSMMHKDA